MCGLFGLSSTYLSDYELDILKPMVHISSLRGIDSVGVCSIFKSKKGKDYKTSILKGALMPSSLIYSSELNKTFEDNKGRVAAVLGHNRHATIGTVNKINAHPFRVGNIVGMHNGSVRGIVPDKSEKTDSEVIFEMLESDGLDATLKKIRDGAFALVWVDSKEGTINFIRNHQRPLHFMTSNGTTMWMSEKIALTMLQSKGLMSNGIIHELPTWTLGTIEIGSSKLIEKKVDYPSPPVTYYYNTSSSTTYSSNSSTDKISTSVTQGYPYTPPPKKVIVPEVNKRMEHNKRKWSGPNGQVINMLQWHKLTKCGCFNCHSKIKLNSIVYFCDETVDDNTDEVIFFCAECYDNGLHRFWNVSENEISRGEEINVE